MFKYTWGHLLLYKRTAENTVQNTNTAEQTSSVLGRNITTLQSNVVAMYSTIKRNNTTCRMPLAA
jgi:hypothetical protein